MKPRSGWWGSTFYIGIYWELILSSRTPFSKKKRNVWVYSDVVQIIILLGRIWPQWGQNVELLYWNIYWAIIIFFYLKTSWSEQPSFIWNHLLVVFYSGLLNSWSEGVEWEHKGCLLNSYLFKSLKKNLQICLQKNLSL